MTDSVTIAEATGISAEKLTWMIQRVKELMRNQGMTSRDAKRIAEEESKSEPWRS